MKKLRNLVIIVVIAAAVVVFGAWAFRPQPIGVDLATITRGTLSVTVSDQGVARVRHTYKVSTPIGGEVERIPLIVGDRVSKGQIVATIVPQLSGFLDERALAEAEASVRAAEASVTSAKADLEAARNAVAYQKGELERTQRLLNRGLVTAQAADQAAFELDSRNAALENAKATLDLRQRQLEQAQAQLIEPTSKDRRSTQFDVRAPVDGEVLEIDNESARSLPAGSQLMMIGDPHDLELVVDLVSTDAVRVVAGDTATITGWGQPVALTAKVRRVEPIAFTQVSALGISEQRVRVILDITSPRDMWQSLGHLYRIFADIEVARYDNAVLVPVAALFRDGSDWACYVMQGEVARLKKLTLGARDSQSAVVESGLDTGARVILHPSDQIVDGSRIVDRATLKTK